MNETRFDFVTVVFSADLRLLQLQARSIARKITPDLVGQICLLINDPNPADVRRHIQQKVLPEYGPFAEKVRIVEHDVYWFDKAPGSGWYSQQVLKLVAAQSVKARHYLVLDAKNHFVRALDQAAFFAPDGRMRSHRPQMSARFLPNYENAFAYLGGSLDDQLSKPLPTTTPFIMQRDFSAALVEWVEALEGRPFQDFFWENRQAHTEFCLYGAYVALHCGGIDRHYVSRSKPTATLYRGSANDAKVCKEVLTALRKKETICMGVHPHVIEVGNGAVLQRIWKNWRKFGLVQDDKDAETFLKSRPPFGRRRFWGFLGG